MNQGKEYMARISDNDVDIVIITALQKEVDAVLSHFDSAVEVKRKGRTFYRCHLSSNNIGRHAKVIIFSQDQMGNVESAMAATQAIDVWNPQYLLLVGIAGGIRDSDRNLGDIVVSEQIVNYEIGKLKSSGLENRWDVIKGSPVLLNLARNMRNRSWAANNHVERPDNVPSTPNVHFAVVGSGEKVIVDENFSNLISGKWSRMAAVEMESYGVAYAAYKAETAPHFLMIKSICDWADDSKNDIWQAYCADIAASYVRSLVNIIPLAYGKRPQAQKFEREPFSHRSKIGLCGRLDDDWEDLADWFDIPLNKRKRFRFGRECQDIWAWLLSRGKLDSLPDGLKGIDREDLLDELISNGD